MHPPRHPYPSADGDSAQGSAPAACESASCEGHGACDHDRGAHHRMVASRKAQAHAYCLYQEGLMGLRDHTVRGCMWYQRIEYKR
ncbi:hypothetical protein BJY01DRAFT_223824 [Aspergillus pseudoustus]|uniref:Copper-fist domain-containing protein n=1 Tax=Aspergillus pseudoustus TaxID=1810923 RepID=A0ABR4J5Q0_9EURO